MAASTLAKTTARSMAALVLAAHIVGCGGTDGAPQQSTNLAAGYEEATEKSVYYYVSQLHNSEFKWDGPTSTEDRIPSNHAVRALACRGDAAVPALLAIARDEPQVDKYSLYDALSEIGIPISQFKDDFYDGKVGGVRAWWDENRKATLAFRTEHRESIGLPPPDLYDEMGVARRKQ